MHILPTQILTELAKFFQSVMNPKRRFISWVIEAIPGWIVKQDHY